MSLLLNEIRSCTICAPFLENGVRPVISFSTKSKILIVGQAPGSKVHASGIPWDDKSGENLRTWMGVSKDTFYDTKLIAIVPMGFCYPGKGKSGDLPPRPECAPKWHKLVMNELKNVKLTLLIGSYAQKFYLNENRKSTLTETVKNFNSYLPKYFVLPHPSPRNNIWRAKNQWFDKTVLPSLQTAVKNALQ